MPLQKIGPFEYRRFEPTLPAFDKVGHEAKRHQVLVVGGGPVGLATALGLANWGIRSVGGEAGAPAFRGVALKYWSGWVLCRRSCARACLGPAGAASTACRRCWFSTCPPAQATSTPQ